MKLSEFTMRYLGTAIAGDDSAYPYRSGPQLVDFFNQFGFKGVYTYGGFPTRRVFAQDRLRALNGSAILGEVIASALDPRTFAAANLRVEDAIPALNGVLKYDGLEVIPGELGFRVRELQSVKVKLKASMELPDQLTLAIIDEHVRKCEAKLADGDFSGAITNARSLVEAVLIGIEKEFSVDAGEYDGDLGKLFKRVQKLLNLEPDRKDIAEPLRQVLSGLVSIVNGLAAVRNKMSDAHGTTYRPSRHHARLVSR